MRSLTVWMCLLLAGSMPPGFAADSGESPFVPIPSPAVIPGGPEAAPSPADSGGYQVNVVNHGAPQAAAFPGPDASGDGPLQRIALYPEAPAPDPAALSARDQRIAAMIQQIVAEEKPKDREGARDQLRRIIESAPDAVTIDRAKYELAAMETDAAARIAAMERLIADHPMSPWSTEACLQIGQFATFAGQPEKSLLAYQAYQKRRPAAAASAQIPMRIAELLEKMSRFDEAIAAYEKILADNPSATQKPLVQTAIAACLMSQGDFVRSIGTIEDVIRESPNFPGLPNLLLNEGLMLEELGKFADASRRYQDVRNLYPRSPEAELALMRLNDLQAPLLGPAAAPPKVAPAPATVGPPLPNAGTIDNRYWVEKPATITQTTPAGE